MSENMATQLKKKLSAKNITAIILFTAIIMVFVFFGLPNKMEGMGVGSVARVNNTLVSLAEFQQEEERIQQYYSQLFGGGMDFSSQRGLLRQQAIETLVRKELISQASDQAAIYATDSEIRDFIVKDIPFLQQNGQFQRDLYSRYLQATRSTPVEFELKIRKDIQNVRLRQLFESGAKPLSFEKKIAAQIEQVKLTLSYAKLDSVQLQKKLGTVEAVDQYVKQLEQGLSTNNESEVVKLLQAQGYALKDSAEFSLSSESVAEIPSLNLKDFISEVSKDQPLLKRVLRQGQDKYVVKLKSIKQASEDKNNNEAENAFNEMNQKKRAEAVFETWLALYREKSKVQIQTQLLK
ncbi:MAG: SurA N-terminal domain-containing protein [Pseudobdellovibrionaceae bacterium]